MLKRLVGNAGWVIPLLVASGFRFVDPDKNQTIANVFFAVATVWGVVVLVAWLRKPRVKFGCLIENDTRINGGIRYVVRLHATTRANVGRVEAHLVAVESGFPRLTTSLPLAWSNEDAAVVPLDGSVPRSILLGFVDHQTGSRDFVYTPTGPGFPDRHLHARIRSVVGQGLVLHVRLVHEETRRWWHSTVQLAVPEGADFPFCSTVIEWSPLRRLWKWVSTPFRRR